jgi:hypothetical protein
VINTPGSSATSWQPAVTLDLNDTSPFKFAATVKAFHEWSESQPALSSLGLSDGWNTVTPQMAENLLRRNPPGNNRQVSLAAVDYYARQMKTDQWKPTGQPIILSDESVLLDGQHRLWAGYLSNVPFDTYVVTNVPHFENMFAYIDNGKVRTATDALATAGVNGLSAVVAAAVRLSGKYDADAIGVMRSKKVERPTPVEILQFAKANPTLSQAAHLQIGEYKSATKLIGYSDIAVFAAWKILDGFGEDTLDHFMSDLGSSEPLAEGDPITLLRKKFVDNRVSADPMPKMHALGYLTKVFNAWRLKEQVKRLFLRTEESWPHFADTTVDNVEAA